MKLSKIKYSSAMFFGVFALIMQLIMGAIQWTIKDYLIQMGYTFNAMDVFVTTPIVSGIATYLIIVIAILLYNNISKKFPIAWEIKK